jgi:FHA domain
LAVPSRDTNDSGDLHPVLNRGTQIGERPPVILPFVTAFERVYPVLRAIHGSFRRPGVLAAAVRDGAHLESHVHLDLSLGPAHALIGRHQRCDLYLAQDPTISLRHALLRATPMYRDARLRLLDLCSGMGFLSEDDVPCDSLVAEGPLFLRAGRYQIFLLPTGDLSPTPFADDARATWDALPERIYLDRRVPDRVPRTVSPVQGGDRATRITQIVPAVRPLRAPDGRPRDTPVVGQLVLRGAGGEEVAHPVTDDDLERGVLVGRYERCQLAGVEHSLSRVHLLVVRDEKRLWAFDTASTNGTSLDGEGIRAVLFERERELGLGGQVRLCWRPQ